jgi:hypothetical protein
VGQLENYRIHFGGDMPPENPAAGVIILTLGGELPQS